MTGTVRAPIVSSYGARTAPTASWSSKNPSGTRRSCLGRAKRLPADESAPILGALSSVKLR